MKRKAIGRVFIEVFDAEAKKIPGVAYLAQGTLYPDVIESVSFKGPSATIKSHHNVGGLPERMHLKLVEPLRELFKDEVRELGRLVDVPDEILQRQPFPGPGLAIRILGAVTDERLFILRAVDTIVVERDQGRRPLSQGLAVLRRAAAGEDRRRHGRRADVRERDRHPRRRERRRHDRRLGAPSVRSARAPLEPHHQRGRRA